MKEDVAKGEEVKTTVTTTTLVYRSNQSRTALNGIESKVPRSTSVPKQNHTHVQKARLPPWQYS